MKEIYTHNQRWMDHFNLLKAFKEHYGNCNVPVNFKTNDGINYDEKGFNLYGWTQKLSADYKNMDINDAFYSLDIKRIELLESIEFYFDRNKSNWDEMFNIVTNYFTYYKTNVVPARFKTKNGIDYDQEGQDLNRWLRYQKALMRDGKLTEIQINKLNSIDFKWNTRKETRKIIDLCKEKNITDSEDLKQLSHLPYKDLCAKFQFLEENGLLIYEDGKLTDLLFMSDKNYEVTFGVTFKELLENHNLKKS